MNYIARFLRKFTTSIDFVSSDKDVVRNEINLFYTKNNHKCDTSIIEFSVDSILFVLSLVGLRVSNEERLTRAVIRELGPDTLRGLGRVIHEFNEADSAYKKSKMLFEILKILKDDGVFSDVKDIVKDEMGWKEWLKTGIIAFAQLFVWFSTDGVAFIAECVLMIMSATDLIEDGYHVDKYCK